MRALVGLVGLFLSGVLKWAFDHFLWDWLTDFLEVKWHLKEATLIASVSSYVFPVLIVAGCIALLYWLARHDISRQGKVAALSTGAASATRAQPNIDPHEHISNAVEQALRSGESFRIAVCMLRR